jgi:integrase
MVSRERQNSLRVTTKRLRKRSRRQPVDCFFFCKVIRRAEDFRQLAERTRADYTRIIQQKIEPEYSDFPLSALTDKRTRGIFMEWRDRLALKSRRQADYAWTVLARVLSWSKDRGKITVNPCERGGRIYSGSRAENIWNADQEAAFLKIAPSHLQLPLLLALWTGQRQGDLLRLPWSGYNGMQIKLRQSKTGCRVIVPVGAPLKIALDAAAERSTIILTTMTASRGRQQASARHGVRRV